jgi:hypothetical protein
MTMDHAGTSAEFPVRDLVRQVTADLAPEEIRALAALDGLSDAEALRQLAASPGRDQRLGFGVGEALALTSAVTWIGVDEAVRQIVDAATKAAGRARHRWWPFSRRRKPAAASVLPPLSTEQLRMVHESVLKSAEGSGLSADRGSRIADAVIRQLVLGPRISGPEVKTEPKTEIYPPKTS